MICALTSVSAVGFNRFMILCTRKSIYQRLEQKSAVAISILLIWLWSFCIVIPPMAGYGEFGYHEKFHTCFFRAYHEESWIYGTVFCCVLGVFPPVLASTFFYAKIFLKLNEIKRNLMRHAKKSRVPTRKDSLDPNTTSDVKIEVTPPEETEKSCETKEGKKSAQLLRQNRRQYKQAVMLVVIFIVIVACWLPISVSFIMDKENRLPSLVYVVFVMLAWANSTVNVFIYAGMNLQFRKAYHRMLVQPFKRHLSQWDTTLNSGISQSGEDSQQGGKSTTPFTATSSNMH